MIDLRKKSLPSAITVGGKAFLIKTDFREWIKFSKMIEEERPLSDYFCFFKCEIPQQNFVNELVEFFTNPNSTPNGNDGGGEKIIDFVEDGEYILASFWKDYGINLLEVDMHWHIFRALFLGLSDDSKIKQIMSMRGWKKDRKSYEQKCVENKRAWSFTTRSDEEKEELLKELDDIFYNS